VCFVLRPSSTCGRAAHDLRGRTPRTAIADFGNQLAWVEADLAAAAQRRAAGELSWMFVAGHRPVYSRLDTDANGKPTGTSGDIQASFEALFLKYGVDLYVAGHMHSVEVSWPVANNTVTAQSYVDPTAPVYVISGAAGCDEGHSDYSNAPTPSWNRFSDGTNYGLSAWRLPKRHSHVSLHSLLPLAFAGVLDIHNGSAFTWTFRRATDGATLDSFTLVRG